MPRIVWKESPRKAGEVFGITTFVEGETIHEHAQPESFTPPHSDMVTVISDPTNEDSGIDKHTFQVGDELYVEDLPKPHIWYTPYQMKHLQMKDYSLALIINKLQKGTHPQMPLPNTYFLNTDGVLYCCVEGSQGFEAIVMPKKHTNWYSLCAMIYLDTMAQHNCMGTKEDFTLGRNWSKIVLNMCVNAKSVDTFLWKNHIM